MVPYFEELVTATRQYRSVHQGQAVRVVLRPDGSAKFLTCTAEIEHPNRLVVRRVEDGAVEAIFSGDVWYTATEYDPDGLVTRTLVNPAW